MGKVKILVMQRVGREVYIFCLIVSLVLPSAHVGAYPAQCQNGSQYCFNEDSPLETGDIIIWTGNNFKLQLFDPQRGTRLVRVASIQMEIRSPLNGETASRLSNLQSTAYVDITLVTQALSFTDEEKTYYSYLGIELLFPPITFVDGIEHNRFEYRVEQEPEITGYDNYEDMTFEMKTTRSIAEGIYTEIYTLRSFSLSNPDIEDSYYSSQKSIDIETGVLLFQNESTWEGDGNHFETSTLISDYINPRETLDWSINRFTAAGVIIALPIIAITVFVIMKKRSTKT